MGTNGEELAFNSVQPGVMPCWACTAAAGFGGILRASPVPGPELQSLANHTSEIEGSTADDDDADDDDDEAMTTLSLSLSLPLSLSLVFSRSVSDKGSKDRRDQR